MTKTTRHSAVMPAAVNAVLDALACRGIDHLEMPLTPLSVWQKLKQ